MFIIVTIIIILARKFIKCYVGVVQRVCGVGDVVVVFVVVVVVSDMFIVIMICVFGRVVVIVIFTWLHIFLACARLRVFLKFKISSLVLKMVRHIHTKI